MSTDFMPTVGTEIAFSAAAPATNDSTGFAALTYTDSDVVGEFGETGANDSPVTFVPAGTGDTEKAQGATDYGSENLNMKYTTAEDAGVAILKAAHAARSKVSVKKTLPDGAIIYYRANCMGVRTVTGGANTPIGLATTLAISGKPVYVDAPS